MHQRILEHSDDVDRGPAGNGLVASYTEELTYVMILHLRHLILIVKLQIVGLILAVPGKEVSGIVVDIKKVSGIVVDIV